MLPGLIWQRLPSFTTQNASSHVIPTRSRSPIRRKSCWESFTCLTTETKALWCVQFYCDIESVVRSEHRAFDPPSSWHNLSCWPRETLWERGFCLVTACLKVHAWCVMAISGPFLPTGLFSKLSLSVLLITQGIQWLRTSHGTERHFQLVFFGVLQEFWKCAEMF